MAASVLVEEKDQVQVTGHKVIKRSDYSEDIKECVW